MKLGSPLSNLRFTFSKYRAFSWRQSLEALSSFVPVLKEPALFTSRPTLLAILSPPTYARRPKLHTKKRGSTKSSAVSCFYLSLSCPLLPLYIQESPNSPDSLGSSVSFKKFCLIPLSFSTRARFSLVFSSYPLYLLCLSFDRENQGHYIGQA